MSVDEKKKRMGQKETVFCWAALENLLTPQHFTSAMPALHGGKQLF